VFHFNLHKTISFGMMRLSDKHTIPNREHIQTLKGRETDTVFLHADSTFCCTWGVRWFCPV